MKPNHSHQFVIDIISGMDPIETEDGNYDVYVIFENGLKYVATFFTLRNLASLINRYKLTGENCSGLYFWATDMIIVPFFSEEVVRKTVVDMLRDGSFEMAFHRCRPTFDEESAEPCSDS